MRGIRNGQGIQSAAFKIIIISDRPNRLTRANPLVVSSEHQVHRSKSLKIEQSPKKAPLDLSARPIENAYVDILKLLDVNSTFARSKPTSLDRVKWPLGWSCSTSISNTSLFYVRESLARPSFDQVGLERSTLAPFGLISLTWVIKALIT